MILGIGFGGLQWSRVCCIRRGANKVAHALAQYARNTLDEDLYWMEDSPPPALEALYNDYLSIRMNEYFPFKKKKKKPTCK